MNERVWVDANVILRFLTGEPPELADEAKLLMKRVDSGEVRLVLTPGIETEDLDLTVEALNLAADQNVDFVDAYLSLKAQAVGEAVCTFDESDFRRLPASWIRPSDC